MAEDMSIERYLEAGGILSNPANVPPRYRAELLKLMATFVDSELAGAAGFADIINAAPGLKERIAAARIVLEKTDHAERVLRLMGEFGADTARYASHHPWTARLPRDADIGATRSGHDMRLAVFNYPLEGWADAVVMNLLMGRAVVVQLTELAMVSYQPLAEAFRAIAPREAHHAELAEEGLAKLAAEPANRDALQAAVGYWWPRVAASFGAADARKFAALKAMGLRRTTGEELRTRWEAEAKARLDKLGLTAG
jgi:ring-1,2-phenylacetyl-CoA epoxidase subunit PaaA